MEEGGEALVPATGGRKVLLISLFSKQAIAKAKPVRGRERGKRRRTSVVARRGSWARP